MRSVEVTEIRARINVSTCHVDTFGKFALIVGNEVSGVSKEILEQSDEILEIEMKGKKESLNVSVATGIALFRILNL